MVRAEVSLRILLHHDASSGFRGLIDELKPDWTDIAIVPEHDRERFASLLPEADVLWHVLEPLDDRAIRTGERLRLIQKLGVGVDTIDLNAARSMGVAVSNMPGTNTNAVAEMTLTLMLATLRRVVFLDARTKAGEGWNRDRDDLDMVSELNAAKVGLVGMGQVAQRVSELVSNFGAEVVYASRSAKPVPFQRLPLSDVMTECDVISLHLPLTEDTQGIINQQRLVRMKSTGVLVNTARGNLVDQPSLIQALTDRRIAGAGLDVFAEEPVISNAFLELENVVLTPHVAWQTPQTVRRSLDVAFENCRRLLIGTDLLNLVDQSAAQPSN